MSDNTAITKDLGNVICGKEVAEFFELTNSKKAPAKLNVVEDNDDDGFSIAPQSVSVPPGGRARFRVTFVSYVPGVVYVKKYKIFQDRDVVAEFCIRCKSLGPWVMTKSYKVKFFIAKNVNISRKRLEIENKSVCPTKFHFERMGNNRPFEIHKESGLLHAQGKIILDIKFVPSKFGVYCNKIYCLLQYHEPILFTLIGVYNPRLRIDQNQLCHHVPAEIPTADNYEAYMSNLNEKFVTEDVDTCSDFLSAGKVVRFEDSTENDGDVESDVPFEEFESKEEWSKSTICSDTNRAKLTNYFLNIGNDMSYSKAVKLINASETKEFFFEWSNDNGKYFSIAPRCGTLKESQKLDLKIDFTSDRQDRLYYGELDVRIFPLKSESDEPSSGIITLPVTLNLSIIGHSFGTGSDGWLEQCEIEPRELVLPPCAPRQTVYSTLLIKRRGQLPVAFEFIPPDKSCIKIKPPLGYISSSYQIFIVQFKASTQFYGKYTETWKVAYNHKTNYYSHIQITVKVENPVVIFGSDNAYKFDTVLPGGISKAAVPIKNPTHLRFYYEFCKPKHMNWIEIPISSGELEPLGVRHLDLIFRPLETNEYHDYICCRAKTIKTPECTAVTEIELRGSCQEGFPVATPAFHDFGICLYGTEQCKIFKLFNFTPVLMHFELHVVNDGAFDEFTSNIIKLIPDKGSISGKSNIDVEVRIMPICVELSKHLIKCKLLASETDSTLACCPSVDARTLFAVKIEVTLPIFQVIDLNVEGGGPLVSPDWLWKMLNVNGLNEMLRVIRPGEEKIIGLRLPEAVVDSSPMMIHLLLETKGAHRMVLEMKSPHRSHFCNQPSWTTPSVAKGFNFMTFTPSKLHLEPNSREVLRLALAFEVVGSSVYEWSMHLSQNRVINIRTVINAIPLENTPQTCTYLTPDVKLRPVYLGDLTPPVQLFWLYNNTTFPSAYVVDVLCLRHATPPFPKIFDCLNPNGVLPPFSCLPLMFIFRPNELKLYKATAHLCLKSDHTIEVNLIGSGTFNYSQFTEFGHERTVPEKPILQHSYIALEQSVKLFTINPFSTFSDTRRIFYLKNTSKESVWAFKWHSFLVNNIIMAKVEPVGGKIEPGGKLLLTLTVKSFKYATNISFSIPCDVIDYTALESYERAVKVKNNVIEKFKDHFTITENGIVNEIPEIKMPIKPKQCHIFVAVRTNIVAESSIEQKLYSKQKEKLQNGKDTVDVPRNNPSFVMNEDVRHVVNETLDKMLWRILSSQSFEKRLQDYQERYGRVTYLQIVPESRKRAEQLEERSRIYLPNYLMGYVIENEIIDILNKIIS